MPAVAGGVSLELIMACEHANDELLVAELARKYLWWKPVGGGHHSDERIIAQAMNLGTFDDIRRLERAFGPHRLAQVMIEAAPGWFSDRSWEFWRGRLSLALGTALPEEPPRRSFDVSCDPVEPSTRQHAAQRARPGASSCRTSGSSLARLAIPVHADIVPRRIGLRTAQRPISTSLGAVPLDPA